MYENPTLIAASLLKRYFEFQVEVNLDEELGVIQATIDGEDDETLKNLLGKLVLIYQGKSVDDGGLSREEISDFFLELSISPHFEEHFDALWENLFEKLSSLEKRTLIDQLPFSPPRYAPVKLATGRTYSYIAIEQFWNNKTRFPDFDNTMTTGILIPDTDTQVAMHEWYEQRGLQKVWGRRATDEGSPSWHAIEAQYRDGRVFSMQQQPPRREQRPRQVIQPALPAQPRVPPPPRPQQQVPPPMPHRQHVQQSAPPAASPPENRIGYAQGINQSLFAANHAEERIKIVCVGSNMDRKRYITQLNPNHPALMTTGIDFFLYTHKQAKFQIWDSAGQERFRTISMAYMRNANAIVIIPEDAEDIRTYYNDFHAQQNSQLFWLNIELADQPRTDEARLALVNAAQEFPDLIQLVFRNNLSVSHDNFLARRNDLQDFCTQIRTALVARREAQPAAEEERHPQARQKRQCVLL